MEPVGLETLNILFGELEVGERLTFRELPCISCGRMVSVEVQRTSAGYGLLKGLLYEPDGPQVHIQCSACHAKK